MSNRIIDMMHFHIPTWQISHFRVPVAFILTEGRQIIMRKLPRNREYFIDKKLGLFHLSAQRAYYFNKVPIFFFDMRHSEPLDIEVLDQLRRWADRQGLWDIHRSDLEHARQVKAYGLDGMTKRQEERRTANRQRMLQIRDAIEKQENAKAEMVQAEGAEPQPQLSEDGKMYKIVATLYQYGYLDGDESTKMNNQITRREIVTVDDLFNSVDGFTKIFVREPLDGSVERVIKEFATYQPKDFLMLLDSGVKNQKALKNLRTKPIVNWAPASYLLFGAIGIAIVVMVLFSGGEMFSTFEDGFLPGSELLGLDGLTNSTDTTATPEIEELETVEEVIESEWEVTGTQADWVEKDPGFYIDRYENETAFRNWFDTHYLDTGEYASIYEAVGVVPP